MLYRMEICVIFARKLVIRRGTAGSLKNGKRKIPIRNPGGTPVVLIPAHQFRVIIVGKRVISPESQKNQGRRGNGGYGGGQMADMAKSMAAMQEVLKKLVPEAVFPKGVTMTDGR